MNEARTTTPGLPPLPDPPQDRCGRPLPRETAELLILVQILLVYARHLLGLLTQAVERSVSLVARCFGAAQAGFVLTHLSRGILRAIALQRVLLACAGGASAKAQSAPAARRPRTGAASNAQPSGPRRPRPSHHQFPGLPTLRQLEAAIRRRPVESVIDEIRRELGICLSLCEARFGNALRDLAAAYRDTLSSVCNEFAPHDSAIADVPERNSAFALPPRKPDAIRYIVGCVIGARQPVRGFPFTASPAGAAKAGAQSP